MYGFLLVFFSNFVPKTNRFWNIRLQTCRDRVMDPSRSLKMSPCGRAHTTSYWRSIVTMALSRVISEINVDSVFSNFVPKTHRFRDIRLGSIQWPWNPGLGSLKVIEDDTIRSGTHDFLLTFYSNHRPISHHFRDKRRKSPVFPPPCIYTRVVR